MTTPTNETTVSQTQTTEETKTNSKEYNFAQLRKSKEQAEYELGQERQARQRLEAELQASKSARPSIPEGEDDDFDDSEPYIDKKSLKKHLKKTKMETQREIAQEIDQRVQAALSVERKQNEEFRIKTQYPDFNEILTEENAQKLMEKKPEMAQKILRIPDEQLRKEMAYQAIKDLNLHKKEEPKADIQAKIDQKMRTPYYYPSSMGSPPGAQIDCSESGKKAAYEKQQALIKGMRR